MTDLPSTWVFKLKLIHRTELSEGFFLMLKFIRDPERAGWSFQTSATALSLLWWQD